MTQESHERIKRCHQESISASKPKRARTEPVLELIPDEILCTTYPDPESVPKVIFSQIDNEEGLKRAVKYVNLN